MKIIAIRHGQTIDNAREVIQGQGSGKLNVTGIKQAKALGRLMKVEKIDFIYCSDLQRCKDTLKEISKYHKHVPVIFTKELRERNWGAMEGKTYTESRLAQEKYKGPRMEYKPKGAESLTELKKRVTDFLKYVKKNHQGEKILFVTHGGTLRMIYTTLTKTSLIKSYGKIRFENTSVSEYEILGPKVKVHRLNEVKHL